MIRALLNTINWYNPRLIPNRPGFHFDARLADGRIIRCETFRKEFGMNVSVRSPEKADLKFAEIVDWTSF